MNNKVELATRLAFRDWLRAQLQALEFYQRRGDHYLIREFAKYCVEKGAPIDEASLGRYLRNYTPGAPGTEGDGPVLPTPERCRDLAVVLEMTPAEVLHAAGYIHGTDFVRRSDTSPTVPTVLPEYLQRELHGFQKNPFEIPSENEPSARKARRKSA